MRTAKYSLSILFSFCIVFSLVTPAQARRPLQASTPLKPPFTLTILVDGNEIANETPECNGCARIFSNLAFRILSDGMLSIQIEKEGPVAVDIQEIPKDFDTQFLKEHLFNVSGGYQSGILNATLTFSQVINRKEWYCPQSLQGEADLTTNKTITGSEGGGTISGWFEYSECTAKDPRTQRFEFEFNWKAVLVCECGCDRVDSQAQFNSLTGTVEITCNPDEVDWSPTNLDEVIYVNDHIATRKNSSAIIQFADFNTFVMKPDTEIVIASPPGKATKLQLVFGRLWNNTKKLLFEGTMQVETSQAVAGIKGTTFVLEHDGSQTILRVITGTVAFTSKATGKSVDVHSNEQVSAGMEGLSEITPFDAGAEQASWLEFADAETLTPSDTVIKVESTTGVATSTERRSGGICGSAALVLGAAVTIIRRKHKLDQK